VLRGYKTSEVDWVLDRLARELEALRGQLAQLSGGQDEAEAEPVEPGDGQDRQDTM
jgi:hypothetical protein